MARRQSTVKLPGLSPAAYLGPRLLPNAVLGIERGTSVWCDAVDWTERMGIANDFMAYATRPGADERVTHGAVLILLTGLAEQLGETSIRCMEAAAVYFLSLHDPWFRAAERYFRMLPDGAVDKWLDANPTFVAFASVANTYFRGATQ